MGQKTPYSRGLVSHQSKKWKQERRRSQNCEKENREAEKQKIKPGYSLKKAFLEIFKEGFLMRYF